MNLLSLYTKERGTCNTESKYPQRDLNETCMLASYAKGQRPNSNDTEEAVVCLDCSAMVDSFLLP